jgi:hypothetical protein
MNRELVTQYSIRDSHARNSAKADHNISAFSFDSLDAPEWLPGGSHKGYDSELCGTVYRVIGAFAVLRGLTL